MPSPPLDGLSPDHLTWVVFLVLADDNPTTRDFDQTLLILHRLDLVTGVPSTIDLPKVLRELKDRGILQDIPGRYGERGWSVAPACRWPAVERMHRQAPGRLKDLARFLDTEDRRHSRYSLGFDVEVQRLLLAVVGGGGPRLTEALARVEPDLVDLDRAAAFEHSYRTVRTLGLVLRFALADGTWTSFSPRHGAAFFDILAYHSILTGAGGLDLADQVLAQTVDRDTVRAVGDLRACALLAAGRIDELMGLSPPETPSATFRGARILGTHLAGDEAGAQQGLGDLLADLARDRGTKAELFVPGPLFPWLACLSLATGQAPASKLKSFAADRVQVYGPTAQVLWSVFRHRGKAAAADLIADDLSKTSLRPLDQLLVHLGLVWNGLGQGRDDRAFVEADAMFAGLGAHWYRLESALAASRALVDGAGWAQRADRVEAGGLVLRPLADLAGGRADWEAPLKRLADLNFDRPLSPRSTEAADQVCWLLDPSAATVQPVVRKVLKGGGWSLPKPAPTTKMAKGDHPALQADDRPALRAYKLGYYGWEFDHKRAIEALAGHPRLFSAQDPDRALVLEAVEIELRADEGPGGLRLSLSAPLDSENALMLKIGPAHYQVLVAGDRIRKVAEVVGSGLSLPPEARERVVEVLGSLASGIQVRSPLLKENKRARTLEADPRPVVLLNPSGEGLSLEVHVRPLGPGTPLLRPGEGPVLVHARSEGGLVTGTRDPGAERRAWGEVLTRCPNLDAWLGEGWSLGIPDTLEALEVLSELRDAGDRLVAEWPRGGKIGLHRRVGTGSMKLALTPEKQWFAVSGLVEVDEGLSVEYRDLLAAGPLARFVRLADGDWVELEAQLLRQLEHLALVGPKVAPLAVASSDLLLDETVTRAVDEAQKWRRRWKEGPGPDLGLPTSVTAELRPYQLEGFRWLARLADIGAGACLADDMGLGKTVQAIALLAHRASEGPSLVVAPTSVAPHWAAEIRRFDRHLDPILFGDGGRADRQALVGSLGPGQVLVVTYGLLVSEEDLLTGRDWNTVVLDEAQAVKNAQTKRAQVVHGLRAGFRMAATGTPLQNHLGELWTLFEFLNPGLLGTKKAFQERFQAPIEGQHHEGARRGLQALVRPFLLRRTKNQVLVELPEKTETTLAVDLEPHERAWYEALRAQALDQMARANAGQPGQQHILVLAHLMKLRRACCHPALAGGPASPTSSKLDLLEELLEGLMDNGHQVLVFSQFTDHLALIRARLDARRWACESLDGSTPSRERTEAVTRFQAGGAPIFLISLQAGGTGLNLTAADYVVHMDPWWNPAVEDQASDRAHRLGQTRPVTIYRLVARDTIEERIVDLHRTKRGLAEALLEGSEAAARLGPAELMGLIAGVGGD